MVSTFTRSYLLSQTLELVFTSQHKIQFVYRGLICTRIWCMEKLCPRCRTFLIYAHTHSVLTDAQVLLTHPKHKESNMCPKQLPNWYVMSCNKNFDCICVSRQALQFIWTTTYQHSELFTHALIAILYSLPRSIWEPFSHPSSAFQELGQMLNTYKQSFCAWTWKRNQSSVYELCYSKM